MNATRFHFEKVEIRILQIKKCPKYYVRVSVTFIGLKLLTTLSIQSIPLLLNFYINANAQHQRPAEINRKVTTVACLMFSKH